MWRAAVVLVVVGCHEDVSREPARAPAPAPAAVPPELAIPVARPKVEATWSNITLGNPGCWYFSGPDGRDTQLRGPLEFARDGDKLRLAWGNATFEGAIQAESIELRRTTTHSFGEPWSVTETLTGTYREGALRAHYRYEECEAGTPCPNDCTIDADLFIAKVR